MRRIHFFAALLAVSLLAGYIKLFFYGCHTAASAHNAEKQPVIVLDAGHGGTDGGAVSADGIIEREINLEITQRLALVMSFCAQRAVLTRTDSNSLASPDAATIKEEKRSDLSNRVTLVNSLSNATLISIHQNSLPGHPEVSGAQVFFNTAAPARFLAESVQQQLNCCHNAGNEKLSKQIDASVYLMKEVSCPAILVECGFLSNPTEARALCTENYQKQLALAITAGYLSYTNGGIT